MKKGLVITLIFMLGIIVISGCTSNGIHTSGSEDVLPFETAKSEAHDKLTLYYPEFEWVYIDYLISYDYQGNPARYHLLFTKENSNISITSFDQLPSLITNVSDCWISEYCENNFATISTRAYKNSKSRSDRNLITNHHRGIPFFYSEKLQYEKQVLEKYPNKKFGRLFFRDFMEYNQYSLIDIDQEIKSGPFPMDDDIIVFGSEGTIYLHKVSEIVNGKNKIQEDFNNYPN